jgi:hypothetical protein
MPKYAYVPSGFHVFARAAKAEVFAIGSYTTSVADAGGVRKATRVPFNSKSVVFRIRIPPSMTNVVYGEDSILNDRLANRQILSHANC